MRKIFLLMALALMAVLVLSACAPTAAPAADSGDAAAAKERLQPTATKS